MPYEGRVAITSTAFVATQVAAIALGPNENRAKLIITNQGVAVASYDFSLADLQNFGGQPIGPGDQIELNPDQDGDLVHLPIYVSVPVGKASLQITEVVPAH